MKQSTCPHCGYIGPVGFEGEWVSHSISECVAARPSAAPKKNTSIEQLARHPAIESFLRAIPDNGLKKILEACVGTNDIACRKLFTQTQAEISTRQRSAKMRTLGLMFCPIHGCHKDDCPPHDED